MSLKFHTFSSIFLLLLLVLPTTVFSQTPYRYERMWPTLKEPWYFFKPADLATDSRGNIYVTDWGHHRVLKFSQDGSFITSWGSEGSGNGQFEGPRGIATQEETIDNQSIIHVYVVDGGNNRIQKFTGDGTFIWRRGVIREPGETDLWLNRIALDEEGYIYVTDYTNNCVKKFRQDSTTLTRIDKWGSIDSGDFTWPYGLAVDTGGYIYVADNGNDRVQQINQNDGTISPWTGFGTSEAQFDEPFGITIDATQNIYVTNNGNGLIQKFNPDGTTFSWVFDGSPDGIAVVPEGYVYVLEWTEDYGGSASKRLVKFSPDGTFLSTWTSEGEGAGEFNQPYGILLSEEGDATHIYSVDTLNNRVQKYSPTGGWEILLDRPDWWFNYPQGIAIDASGSIYIADENNRRILKINQDYTWTTWSLGFSYYPYGVAVDPAGENIYITAREGLLFWRILRLNPGTGELSVWGSGFNQPRGITVAPDGNIYVADTGNNLIKRCTTAGSCTPCGSGLNAPRGVAVDTAGTIYVADTGHDQIQIFDQDCVLLATLGTLGSMPGQLSYPTNLAVGSDGRIYVSDTGNNRIQVFKKYETPLNPKAIIVAGGGPYPGNSLWDATQATANFAYRTLLHRGFQKDHILYLSSNTALDFEGDGIPDVTDIRQEDILEYARQWTLEEPAAESLILYVTDHGGDGSFIMDGNVPQVTLEAPILATWVNELQPNLSDGMVFIYDACESGSFLEPLTGDNRIVVASTSPGERAKFLNQGTISFSSFFWTHIFNRQSIQDAYLKARQVITFAFDDQNPLISGNAENTYIDAAPENGTGQLVGDAPHIARVFTDPGILVDQTAADIYAEVIDPNNDTIARVWAVIWPPGLDLGETVEIPLVDQLKDYTIELLPDTGNRYRGTYGNFTRDAVYPVIIYAMDGKGNTSVPAVTLVHRNYTRKAIIVEGLGANGEQQAAMGSGAAIAYNALKSQFVSGDDTAHDNIYFMSVSGVEGFDGIAPSLSNLHTAIDQLGTEKNLDLVLYITGWGSDKQVRISDTDTLEASQLATWLTTLQTSVEETCRVTVIYDGNNAGTFIPELTPSQGEPLPAGKQRILITSTGADGSAYFSEWGETSFSHFFWGQVAMGASLYNAYAHAQNTISYFTRSNDISFSCYKPQDPLLEANGNGVANELADFKIADELTIGLGILFADETAPPAIGSAWQEEIDGGVLIGARNITGTIKNVWAVVSPLDYCPGNSGERPAVLHEIPLEKVGDGWYEGTLLFADIPDMANAYEIFVYAQDVDNTISAPKKPRVLWTEVEGRDIFEPDDSWGSANVIVPNYRIPQPHNFHRPDDNDWVKFYGFAEEGLTYRMKASYLAQDCYPIMILYAYDEDNEDVYPVPGGVASVKQGTVLLLDLPLPHDGVYYLRLYHSPTGESPEEWEGKDYDLQIDNTDASTIRVSGRVENISTREPISGADITSDRGGGALSTNGEYMFTQIVADFTLFATADGYTPYNTPLIDVEVGDQSVVHHILMNPERTSIDRCSSDTDCDDGFFCNGVESCVDKKCQAGTDPCQDDGLFCNGVESCDERNNLCLRSGNPCLQDLTCSEDNDTCVGCSGNEDCDDGLFCNGFEVCQDEECQNGSLPCPEEIECDDDTDACKYPHLSFFPPILRQSRWIPMPVLLRITGTHTHFGSSTGFSFSPASLMALPPVVFPQKTIFPQETILCIGIMMPSWVTGQAGGSVEVTVKTGSEVVVETIEIAPLPFMLTQDETPLVR